MTQSHENESRLLQYTLVEVDRAKINNKRSESKESLEDLHNAIGKSLWPVEDMTPNEPYEGPIAYPGRVLIGVAGSRDIGAYLMRTSKRGDSIMEFYYNDVGGAVDRKDFKRAQFGHWCHSITKPDEPAGSSKGDWEKRVKAIVECVMLEAEHFDGILSLDPDIPTLIRQNAGRVALGRSPPLSMTPATQDGDPHASYSLVAQSNNSTSSDSLNQHRRAESKDREPQLSGGVDPVITCIQALREAVPRTDWFKTNELSDIELELVWTSKKPTSWLTLCSGKVLLGVFRDNVSAKAGMSVWATIKCAKPRNWRKCAKPLLLFDDDFEQVILPPTLEYPIQFDRVFRLLYDKNTAANPGIWTRRVEMCVKAALIKAKRLNQSAIDFQVATEPEQLKKIIKHNLEKEMDQAATRNTNGSDPNAYALPHRTSSIENEGTEQTNLDTCLSESVTDVGAASASHISARPEDSPASLGHSDVENQPPNPSSLATGIHSTPTEEQPQPNIDPKPANKKRKLSMEDSQSLLKFVSQATSTNLIAHAALEQQVRILSAEKAEQETLLRAQIKTLEAERKKLTDEFQDQDKKNQILELRINSLIDVEKDREDLEDRVRVLEKDYNALWSEKDVLKDSNDVLLESHDVLQERNKVLKNRNKALEDENKALQRTNKAVQESNAEFVKHCQPLMLEALKNHLVQQGIDEESATREAEARCNATFGIKDTEQTDEED